MARIFVKLFKFDQASISLQSSFDQARSALTGLEAALNLVDHVNPALAADQTVVAMATTQRFQRVTDLHGQS
jgi:hypothetical protein